MCKLYYFIQAMSYTASILILTAISIERYFAIRYPLKTKQFTTVFRLAVVVGFIWILAAVYAGPMLLFYDVIIIPHSHEAYCLLVYDMNMRAYVTCNFVICYLFPLAVISVLYVRISVVLWRSSQINSIEKQAGINKDGGCKKKMSWGSRIAKFCHRASRQTKTTDEPTENALLGEQTRSGHHVVLNCTTRKSRTNSPQNRIRKRNDMSSTMRQKESRCKESALMGRRRVMRLLLVVVVLFAACVLPYHVRLLRQYWTKQEFSFEEKLFTPLSFIFYYLNSALNPVVYAFLSANFRRSLKELITCQRTSAGTVSARSATYAMTGMQSTSCKTMHSTL